jgi:hypothetical protein
MRREGDGGGGAPVVVEWDNGKWIVLVNCFPSSEVRMTRHEFQKGKTG